MKDFRNLHNKPAATIYEEVKTMDALELEGYSSFNVLACSFGFQAAVKASKDKRIRSIIAIAPFFLLPAVIKKNLDNLPFFSSFKNPALYPFLLILLGILSIFFENAQYEKNKVKKVFLYKNDALKLEGVAGFVEVEPVYIEGTHGDINFFIIDFLKGFSSD